MHISGIMVLIFFFAYYFFSPILIDSFEYLPSLDETIWYNPIIITFTLNSIFFTGFLTVTFSNYEKISTSSRNKVYISLGMIFITFQLITLLFFILLEVYFLKSIIPIVNNVLFLFLFEIIYGSFFVYHWNLKYRIDQLKKIQISKFRALWKMGGLIVGLIYQAIFIYSIFLFMDYKLTIFTHLAFISFANWIIFTLYSIVKKQNFGLYGSIIES